MLKVAYTTISGATELRESDFIDAVDWLYDNRNGLHCGFTFCMDRNMRVAVTSVGFEDDGQSRLGLDFAFDDLYNFGNILTFAAAGNSSGAVGQPASFPGVIAVGQLGTSMIRRFDSPRGPELEFMMPGQDIFTNWNFGGGNGSGTHTGSGTSYAAPLAAGAALLYLSNREFMSARQVREQMQESARDLGPAGFDPDHGYGSIDLPCLRQEQFYCQYGQDDGGEILYSPDAPSPIIQPDSVSGKP